MRESYTLNGLYFRRVRNFWIVYHDAKKASANYGLYCNAGFFANFKNNKGKIFTLPVANLVCDPWQIPVEGRDEAMKHWINGKLRFSTYDPHTTQFKGRLVSTLVIGKDGKPFVGKMSGAPSDCQYAISGIPCIRNGDIVSMESVLLEGWDWSPMYGTMRNWIGLRNGEIWLINGTTKTSNYLIPDKTGRSEFWEKVRSEGFSDILALDGGGSAYFSDQNGVKKTWKNRRINNVIVFS